MSSPFTTPNRRRKFRSCAPHSRSLLGRQRARQVASVCAWVTILLVSGGCSSDDDGDQGCSAVGCVDQVLLQPRDAAGNLVLNVAGTIIIDGVEQPFDCGTSTNENVLCTQQGVVLLVAPTSKLSVSLTSGNLAVEGMDLEPVYSQVRPNGPGCSPVCTQATVDVPLGGSLTDVVASDAQQTDAGGVDAGLIDSAVGDADSLDAGVTDAGMKDVSEKDSASPGGCCKTNDNCVKDEFCVGDVCKASDGLGPNQCWTAAQCGGNPCQNALICPCGAPCFAPDKPGTCAVPVDGGAPDAGALDAGKPDAGPTPGGCCKGQVDCAKGLLCAGGMCKDTALLKTGECWSDSTCKSGKCVGASVCPCGAPCAAPDKPGQCTSPCAKIDPNGYGLCDMVLGAGWNGSKCVNVSGCGCKKECDKLFKTVADCNKTCLINP